MTEQNWSENITPEQKEIMKILSAMVFPIVSLFDVLAKDTPERTAYLCKLGYVETLSKALELDKEGKNEGKENSLPN